MIRNNDELAVVRQQLNRAEGALLAISREVKPQSEERYHLMAEPYLGQIREIRSQIDAYVGVTEALQGSTNLVMSLQGPRLRLGDTPVSLITRALETFRKGIQKLAAGVEAEAPVPSGRGRRGRWIEKVCDPPLVSVTPGSVRIELGMPDTGDLFSREGRRLYEHTFSLIRAGLTWVNQDDATELDTAAPSPELRKAVLSAIRSMVPAQGGPVEAVVFAGRLVGRKSLALKKAHREKLEQAIRTPDVVRETVKQDGTMRELDLDKPRFILRQRPGGQGDLMCVYRPDMEAEAKEYLDTKVTVSGVMGTSTGVLQVETIEPCGEDDDADADADTGSESPGE